MRQVTLLNLAQVEDPIVRAALQQIQDASADNIINDVANSGAALSTIKDAAADEIAYYAGPTDVELTAFTAFARLLVAAADAAAALAVLGISGSSVYLQVAQNLADLANVATARTNLGVTATGADTTYNFRANNLSDVASAATARTNLGLAIGADVQAFDAQLSSDLRVVTITANTNIAATHKGKALLMQGTTASQAVTIVTKASGAPGQGATITIENYSTQVWTLVPAGGVTLYWAPTLATGTRTLASGAVATIHAVFDDQWSLTGVGVT